MTEVKKLAAMIELVKQLNSSDWNVKTAAENDQYIRVNGGTFRAVSLADESALCGFTKQGAKNIETIKNHFKNNQPQNLANDVFEAKKERRLQSRIIKKALLNERNLLHESLFGAALKDHFDELLFAFDEVSFEKNRVDLIAVGKKENKIFPVVIELKSNRSLTRLVEQLNDASDAILKNLAEIKTLLKLVTGLDISDGGEIKKVLVWTEAKNSARNKTRDSIRDLKDIIFIEYSLNDKNFPDVTFELNNGLAT